MSRFEQLDDLWWGEFEETDGWLYRRLFQPARREILADNQRLRESGVVEDRELFGRWALQIPMEDWEMLGRSVRWRELHSEDKETRQRAFRKFLKHSDSAPYRVRERAS